MHNVGLFLWVIARVVMLVSNKCLTSYHITYVRFHIHYSREHFLILELFAEKELAKSIVTFFSFFFASINKS